jgi:hypothetical protein
MTEAERLRRKKEKHDRLLRALKARFPGGPEDCLRAMGMDSSLLSGPPEKRSESILNNRGAMEMAAHGHSGDEDMDDGAWDEKVRSFLSDKGWDENSISELFEMLPERQHIKGEKVERGTEDDMESEGRLESPSNMRKSATNSNRRDDERAKMTEHRNSEQSEDRMPGRSRGYLPENHMSRRMAGDADLQFVRERLARSPEVFVGGSATSWRAEVAANAEVARVRRLAGVGGRPLGMDAKAAATRSERILKVTTQEQARRQRSADDLAKRYPEIARINIQP